MKNPYGYEGKKWVAYFWFQGWRNIQLGLHVDLESPNMEIHLPFGFVRLGRRSKPVIYTDADIRLGCLNDDGSFEDTGLTREMFLHWIKEATAK